jgi:threonine dehydratase
LKPSMAARVEEIAALAASVAQAHARLQGWRAKRSDAVLWTPLLRSRSWLEPATNTGAPVLLKLESEQVTGSFKVRGALNAITKAFDDASDAGDELPRIVTASTGNHALAVAHALELTATPQRGCIFLPTLAKAAKVKNLRSYQRVVELRFTDGDDCLLSEVAAGQFAAETPGSAVYVSPCNSYEVMAGQGTIAIEIMETIREQCGGELASSSGSLYLTVGGGGMVSGVGAWMKTHAPGWRVVGAQPANSPVMFESVKNGGVVHMESLPTLSDGSAGGLEDGTRDYSCICVIAEGTNR